MARMLNVSASNIVVVTYSTSAVQKRSGWKHSVDFYISNTGGVNPSQLITKLQTLVAANSTILLDNGFFGATVESVTAVTQGTAATGAGFSTTVGNQTVPVRTIMTVTDARADRLNCGRCCCSQLSYYCYCVNRWFMLLLHWCPCTHMVVY